MVPLSLNSTLKVSVMLRLRLGLPHFPGILTGPSHWVPGLSSPLQSGRACVSDEEPEQRDQHTAEPGALAPGLSLFPLCRHLLCSCLALCSAAQSTAASPGDPEWLGVDTVALDSQTPGRSLSPTAGGEVPATSLQIS